MCTIPSPKDNIIYLITHKINKYISNLLDGGAAGPRETRAAFRFLATSAAVSLVALRFCLERFIVVGGI